MARGESIPALWLKRRHRKTGSQQKTRSKFGPEGDLEVTLVGGHCQQVAAIVLRMTTMPGDSRVADSVAGQQHIERTPEIVVLDRLKLFSLAPLPRVGLPLGKPLA